MSCRTSCGPEGARCRPLVRAACADDDPGRDALGRLVEQSWPEVRALVRRSGDFGRDADDLTQAYFLRFIEKDYVRRLETWEGCIRPFLVTTVRHFVSNAGDHARALKRGGGARTLSLEEALAVTRPRAGLVAAWTPESLLASAERQSQMRRAIAEVMREVRSSEQRRRQLTLLDRLADGGDDREIAARWGVSPVAVRVAAHRLRRRLARALASDAPRPAAARLVH